MLAGCRVAPPWPENTPAEPPARADEAAEMVAAAWSARLSLPEPLDPPPVYWFEGECLRYSESDWCDPGSYWDDSWPYYAEIHLVLYDRISDSFLAHEMLHAALGELGNADADHVHPAWEAVGEVRQSLVDAGL